MVVAQPIRLDLWADFAVEAVVVVVVVEAAVAAAVAGLTTAVVVVVVVVVVSGSWSTTSDGVDVGILAVKSCCESAARRRSV